MIPTNYDGGPQFAFANHFVKAKTEPGAFAVAQPTNTSRQALELHLLASQSDPASQILVFRKRVEDSLIGAINIFRIARKSYPTKRPFAFAEKRTNVFRHKPGDLKNVGNPRFDGLGPDVVAIFERDRASTLKLQHCLHVKSDRFPGPADVFLRIVAT